MNLAPLRRMLRLAGMLVVVLSGAALADQPAASRRPVAATARPASKSPLRVLRILPNSQQAVLFDKSRGSHVMVEVGTQVGAYTVIEIDDDTVTLGARGQQLVLAAPAPAAIIESNKAVAASPTIAPTPAVVPSAPTPGSSDSNPVDPYAEDLGRDTPTRPAPMTTTATAATPTAPAVPAPTTAASTPAPAAAPATPAPATPAPATPAPATPAPATVAPATVAPATTTPVVAAPVTAAPTVAAPASAGPTTTPAAEPTPSDPYWVDELPVVGAGPLPAAPVAPSTIGPGPAPAPALPTGPLEISLARTEINAALDDFGGLLASIRGEQTANGVRFDLVADKSVFARAGLRTGDVVTSVDGKALRSLDDTADLYARAATARAMTVQVVRGGKPLTIKLVIR